MSLQYNTFLSVYYHIIQKKVKQCKYNCKLVSNFKWKKLKQKFELTRLKLKCQKMLIFLVYLSKKYLYNMLI